VFVPVVVPSYPEEREVEEQVLALDLVFPAASFHAAQRRHAPVDSERVLVPVLLRRLPSFRTPGC